MSSDVRDRLLVNESSSDVSIEVQSVRAFDDNRKVTSPEIDSVCASFEESWQTGRRPEVEAALQSVSDDKRSILLLRLLEIELHCRLNLDEHPSVEEYEQRFPDAVDDLKQLFAEMPTVNPGKQGLVSTISYVPVGKVAHVPPADESPGRHQFGDYELLEEIARGGMGVVYKALQKKANRIVALKMILSGQHASEEELQRFRSEAEAAALLDHPHIVPIFDVGEQNGQPYFSMGYVDGESLQSKLREGPLPSKEAAGIVKTVSQAIASAHDHGVIHRDLKPSNVLIDKSGNPRVTDFGLAKQIESDSNLTATGQVMGTPSYMPPEQASGDLAKIDARSDVYSLGAVLYALLTGRPPFQSANMIETLRQVTDDAPVEPRMLNPAVDQDLETICLKCLEKDPARRYQQASELSEELSRYLEGKPIVARSITRIERVWRWCKRKPLVAGSLLAAVASLLIGMALSIYFAVLAQQRAKHAEQGTRVALTALETMIDKLQNDLRSIPGAQEVRRDLLKEALVSLQTVSGEVQTQSRVDRDTAVALVDLAILFEEFGDEQGLDSNALAESNFRTATEIFRELVSPDEQDVSLLRDQSWALAQFGSFYLDRNRVADAKEPLEQALAIRRHILSIAPDDIQLQFRLTLSLADWGDYLSMKRDFAAAINVFEETIELTEQLVQSDLENVLYLRELSGYYLKLGDAYHDQHKSDQALAIFETCRETVQRMFAIEPNIPSTHDVMSLTYERLGNHWLQVGDAEQALAMYAQMREHLERALEIDPDNRIFRDGLSVAFEKLASAQSKAGLHDAAANSRREATRIRQELSVKTSSQ